MQVYMQWSSRNCSTDILVTSWVPIIATPPIQTAPIIFTEFWSDKTKSNIVRWILELHKYTSTPMLQCNMNDFMWLWKEVKHKEYKCWYDLISNESLDATATIKLRKLWLQLDSSCCSLQSAAPFCSLITVNSSISDGQFVMRRHATAVSWLASFPEQTRKMRNSPCLLEMKSPAK